jgi:hypothetical protein
VDELDVRLKTMPATIPDCDDVFSKFFDRWYDDDDRQRKGFAHTRPDMMAAYRTGLSGSDICPLSEASRQRVLDQIATMLKTAHSDWSTYLHVSGEIDMDWVEAADSFYDTERIAALIDRSDPEDFSNDLVVTVCQFGAVLGHVMRQSEPRLEWVAEWPYWESALYDPATGNIIPPFHWAIKKFSDYGVDDGCVPKIGCMIHNLNNPDEKP